jgi:drug/metabolite transporter (DMT)-like permease
MDSSVEENVMTKGSRYYNPLILWPPAVLNMISSSLTLFGLMLTNSSSFQLISCSVIIFVVLLSMCIFKRFLKSYELIGLVLIIFGLIIIGTTQTIEDAKDELLGGIMIAVGQFLAACQYVYEEAAVVKLDIPPLQFVALEGMFGFIILTIFIFPLEFFPLPEIFSGINSSNTVVNNIDALIQIYNQPLLLAPIFIFMLSIAFYAFSGIYLTKELIAITRLVFDSLRIVIVWAFSAAISWQEFNTIQVSVIEI